MISADTAIVPSAASEARTTPLLSVERVTKDYKTDGVSVRALNDVSIGIDLGKFVALVGRSGCGKSTLLNLAGAMDFPTGGHVLLDGVATDQLSEVQLTQLRCEKVGFIFQSFQMLHTLRCDRERRTSAIARGTFGLSPPSSGATRIHRTRRACSPHAPSTLRRPDAARSRGSVAGSLASHPPRRRANGKPRYGDRKLDPGTAPADLHRAENDDPDGDTERRINGRCGYGGPNARCISAGVKIDRITPRERRDAAE